MPILDAYGRPVKTSDLTKEIATPTVIGVRGAWYDSMATGLTPEYLGEILAGVDRNDIQNYLTLAEEMEERDLHYSSVLRTRKLAVTGLKITVEATSDDKKEVEIAEYVQEVVSGQEFENLLADQLDALGKGFSVSEIMWDRSGKRWEPRCYEHRDPRFFQFDWQTGRELRMRDDSDLLNGIPLAPYKFIVHYPRIKTGLKIRGGLARLAVVAFMCKGYTLKDWLAFAEVFGMPLRVGKYGTNASADQKRELLRAVSNIGHDAAAIIPDSMLIDFVQADRGSGGDKLFMALADWLDSQVSKGVLGQTMTTDNGSSLAQAKVHDEVRDDIKLSDAKQLAATIRRDLVKPLIDLNFGERAPRQYPNLRLVVEENEDLESLSRSLPPFIKLGLRVQESVIRDKFGLPEPEEGAILLAEAAAPAQAPTSALSDKDEEEVTKEVDDVAEARRAILRKLLAGEELTKDQRAFLSRANDDEVDRLADDDVMSQWQRQMDPMLEPIIRLAEAATSYEDLVDQLDRVQLSADELVEMLAKLTFKARGLGDGTDKV